VSCGKNNRSVIFEAVDASDVEIINIDVKNGIRCPLDSLFTNNVWFVRLETTNESLIGEVSKVLFADSLIFVVDAEQTKSIFIYDMRGKYISKIAKFGNGHGEYTMIHNVFIDSKNERLVIVDTPQRKMIYFSYRGDFITEESRRFASSNTVILPSGNNVYYCEPNNDFFNNGDNVLVVTNDKKEVIYTACREFHNNYFYYAVLQQLWNYDGQVFFYPNWQDTLFLITDTVAIAQYYINVLPDKMPQPQDIPNLSDVSFADDYLKKYPYFNGQFVEFRDYTLITLAMPRGNSSLHAFYSHRTKKTYIKNFDFYDYLYSFCRNYEMLFASRYKDNTVVVPFWPHNLPDKKFLYQDMPKLIKEFGFNNKTIQKQFLDSLYNNMEDDDNPILFFYEINPAL
jgi:hypothetical protein